ncbi:MAG: CDP-alcohol phosphatidyltransferase family protein [Lachnospiraceae bacterium]|nr:CDP-alcohol phosphatidyltransferase family protein [Lachnospiraceae bacterium]
MNWIKKNKHLWVIPIYGIFYLLSFGWLEKHNTVVYTVHAGLDDLIPFNEYFIIPYMLWFAFVAAVVCYFAFFAGNRKEYWQLIWTLGTGMTVFLIVSFLFPNGQELRPEVTGSGFFQEAVRILYKIDTPTNILPSIHVFNSAACWIAVAKAEGMQRRPAVKGLTGCLAVLIILSTMLLKQHSVVDVSLALLLNVLCYYVFYRFVPEHYEELAGFFTKKELLTIPNLLSAFRLVLAILFLGIYQRMGLEAGRERMGIILILSAVSDFLDGKIARRFHMVSEVGKILDPVADKLTQGVLLICLLSRYRMASVILMLFLLKECCTTLDGARTIAKARKNDGAKWYGKVSTAVFYAVMLILNFVPGITDKTADFLLGVSGVFILLAFVMYTKEFRNIRKNSSLSHMA